MTEEERTDILKYLEEYEQEVWKWSGSAFLAGERVSDVAWHKAELYNFMCRLGNVLSSIRDDLTRE